MLWVDLFGIYIGGESGSISALEAGGGARYRKYFLGTLGVIKELKSPCDHRGYG